MTKLMVNQSLLKHFEATVLELELYCFALVISAGQHVVLQLLGRLDL